MTNLEPGAGPTTTLPIIHTYPTLCDLRLHSLAYALVYWCAHCLQRRSSTMIAVTGTSAPVCPGCYAERLRAAA